MTAPAAQALLPHDRVCDWHDEVQRLLPTMPLLPPAAQRAVLSVVASIADEDARAGANARPARPPETVFTLLCPA